MPEATRPWLRPLPPPPDASSLPPDLVAHLQGLRYRYAADPGGGSRDRREIRNAYDQVLVQVADLLEIPGAPEPDLVIGRRVLTIYERSLLEKAVMAAGLDLGIEARPRLRALGPPAETEPAPPPPRWSATAPSPPPWQPPAAPRPAADASPRAELARQARGMRRRLDAYESDTRLWPTKVDEWCEDLDTYDGVLVDLAAALRLPASSLPSGGRRRLLSEERVAIEAGLARAGIDLGAS